MIYKRLLDDLTSTTTPFDFNRVWQHLGLNPRRKFSNNFMKELYGDHAGSGYPNCLDDFEDRWEMAISTLGVNAAEGSTGNNSPVHSKLTLVYRRRDAPEVQEPNNDIPVEFGEDPDLQAALIASLESLHTDSESSVVETDEEIGEETVILAEEPNVADLDPTDSGSSKHKTFIDHSPVLKSEGKSLIRGGEF